MKNSTPVYQEVGHRKNAIVRIAMRPGTGKILVNNRDYIQYFGRIFQRTQVVRPLQVASLTDKYDIVANARGGGLGGQAEALRHAIANALIQINPDLKPLLRKEGFITRDARIKERKKYGLAGARKAFQWTKR